MLSVWFGALALAQAPPAPCGPQLPAPDFGGNGGFRVLVLGVQAPGIDAEVGPEPLSTRLERRLGEEVASSYGKQAGLVATDYRVRQLDCAISAEAQAWQLARTWGVDLVLYPGAGTRVTAAVPRKGAPSATLGRAQALYWYNPIPERFSADLAHFAESEALPLLVVGLELAREGALQSAQDYLDEAYSLLYEGSPGSAARTLALLAHAQLRAGQVDNARLTVSDLAQGCGTGADCLPVALEERAMMAFASGDAALAIAAYERLLEHTQAGADPAATARARFALGRARAEGGQLAQAQQDLSAALDAFVNLGDLRSSAICRLALAEGQVLSGEPERAAPLLGQALDAFRHLQDLAGEAWTHEVRAWALLVSGDTTLARRAADEAVAVAQRTPDLHAQALATQRLAEVQAAQGDLVAAIASQERALVYFEASRDAISLGPAQLELGRLNQRAGRAPQAELAWGRAAELCGAAGQVRCEVKALESQGRSALSRGQVQPGVALLEQAIQRVNRLGDSRWEAELRRSVGEALEAAGERRAALAQYQQALAVAERVQDLAGQAELGERVGDTHAAFGEEQQALAAYGRAVPAWVGLGELEHAATLWLVMADICADRQEPAPALEAAQPLLNALGELNDPAVRATVRMTAAGLARAAQDPAGAAALYDQAAGDAQAAADPARRLDATLRCAESYAAAGQADPALRAYQGAVALVGTPALKAQKPAVRDSLTASALTGPQVDALLLKLQ